MSFSTDIKNEVTKLDSTKTEYISELSAIIRNTSQIENSIKIHLENPPILISRYFSCIESTVPFI